MIQRNVLISAAAILAPVLCTTTAAAEMGPCKPANSDLLCGSGNGAARGIVKTISPSQRLAFAWRLADKPPTSPPQQDDPSLENLVVRIEDGAVLAKSHGAYWDLGTKIAKAYLFAAWSPDSRLLVKVEQRAETVSAELFAFAENDAASGPFELSKVIEPALRAKIEGLKKTDDTVLVFAVYPAMSIDDNGLLNAVASMRIEDARDTPNYKVTVQVTHFAGAVDAKVVSVTPYRGVSGSVIVH
jgi:hypothetical protein